MYVFRYIFIQQIVNYAEYLYCNLWFLPDLGQSEQIVKLVSHCWFKFIKYFICIVTFMQMKYLDLFLIVSVLIHKYMNT